MAPSTTTSFTLRLILEKDKLNGTSYMERVDDATAAIKNAYKKACDSNLEVSCLMLACMEPELQMQFETNHEAHDIIMALQDMF
jgi:hypothetical protein